MDLGQRLKMTDISSGLARTWEKGKGTESQKGKKA